MSDSESTSPPDDPDPAFAKVQDDELPDNPAQVAAASAEAAVLWYRRRRRRQFRICIFLFVATLVSTTLVGSRFLPLELLPGFFHEETRTRWVNFMEQIDPSPGRQMRSFNRRYLEVLFQGFSYSGPLMLILLCHEMGHFLQAVRYRVPASFPFFIPLPIPPLGTMGAVIAQERGTADRKQMFDIAVSGPLAGLLVTLPVLYAGIKASRIGVLPAGSFLEFGEPAVIQWMIAWIHGPTPDGYTLYMNGVARAGWVGVFVTALNLIPIGQLDGGHLTYTLLGRPAHWIAIALVGVAAGWMFYTETYSYILFLILIMLMGTKHPPTCDDTVSLGVFRHILGWLTLGFLLIGFTPNPIAVGHG